MARFYGTIQGARGPASRLGHANSGLHVTAQSYSGDVVTKLDAHRDKDYMHVSVREHSGSHILHLYAGSFDALKKGGPVEVMRYLYESCSPYQRHKFMDLIARRALQRAYEDNDAQGN